MAIGARTLRAIGRAGRRLRRGRRVNTRARKTRAVMPRGNFAKAVKQVLMRNAETKYTSDNYNANGAVALDAVWDLTDVGIGVNRFLPMVPRIGQGAGNHRRDGDMIQPSSRATTNLQFSYNNDDISGHQVKVEVWYGTTKTGKTWQGENPLSTANFLENGDGTNSGPSFARQQTQKPTNKELVSFTKKVFILSKALGTTGGPIGNGNFSANGGKSYHSMSISVPCPKKLKYEDDGTLYPTNFAPGYIINLSYVDGVLPATQAEIDTLVNITSRTHLHFKDF